MALRKKSRKVNNKNKNKRIRKSRRCRRKVGGEGFKVGDTVYYKKKYYDDSITEKYTVTYKIIKVNNINNMDDTYNIECIDLSVLNTYNDHINTNNNKISENNDIYIQNEQGSNIGNSSSPSTKKLLEKIENVPVDDLTLVVPVRKVVRRETNINKNIYLTTKIK